MGKLKPRPFGKYLLLDRINVGGMAEVYVSKTFGVEGFERLVAIKRILPSIMDDAEFCSMFIDEAKIAVQLAHANVTQIYELGRITGTLYIAMEFVHGKDLRAIWDRARKRKEKVPINIVAQCIANACEGLDYAHRKTDPAGSSLRIVHRDVSPQNVLVSYEGEVKIIDFGIAKAATRASNTQAGILKGKFSYMSPEQVRNKPLDNRSDIFSIGIILYEMLVGERLFVGESDFSTLERVRNVELLPPTTYNRDIPRDLERVVLKALARDVDERYQNASDMHDDLVAFLIKNGIKAGRSELAGYMKSMFGAEYRREMSRIDEYRAVRALPEGADDGAEPRRDTSPGERGRDPMAEGETEIIAFNPVAEATDTGLAFADTASHVHPSVSGLGAPLRDPPGGDTDRRGPWRPPSGTKDTLAPDEHELTQADAPNPADAAPALDEQPRTVPARRKAGSGPRPAGVLSDPVVSSAPPADAVVAPEELDIAPPEAERDPDGTEKEAIAIAPRTNPSARAQPTPADDPYADTEHRIVEEPRRGFPTAIAAGLGALLLLAAWGLTSAILATDEVPAQVAAIVAAPAPAPAPAFIDIHSEPLGAEIMVNGVLEGKTPATEVEVQPGAPVEIVLSLEGHDDVEVALVLAPGERRDVRLQLVPRAVVEAPGTPAEDSKPKPVVPPPPRVSVRPATISVLPGGAPWAHVFVDGKDIGKQAPLPNYPLPPGTHTITLKRPDLKLQGSVTVPLGAGENKKLRVVMR